MAVPCVSSLENKDLAWRWFYSELPQVTDLFEWSVTHDQIHRIATIKQIDNKEGADEFNIKSVALDNTVRWGVPSNQGDRRIDYKTQ